MDFPSNFTKGTPGGGVPPTQPPSGYVHQKYISVVFGYKEVKWPPYTYRSFCRSRRALPGTTKKLLDSCNDTSVKAVGKFFYLRKIFYGCNGFSIKFYEGYPWAGVPPTPPQGVPLVKFDRKSIATIKNFSYVKIFFHGINTGFLTAIECFICGSW